MSDKYAQDMEDLHDHYGVHEVVSDFDKEKLRKLLEFRIEFLKEELAEIEEALQNNDPEEIVDGHIDLCVIAIGTLDLFKVNTDEAWDEVYEANMNKEAGINPTRPNPLGLPDLIKPDNWQAPSHEFNHGLLTKALEDE